MQVREHTANSGQKQRDRLSQSWASGVGQPGPGQQLINVTKSSFRSMVLSRLVHCVTVTRRLLSVSHQVST